MGTGSGILGIVALKLGAAHVTGTDLDPCAVPAVAENKEANNISDGDFDMLIGNIIDDREVQDQVGYEKYDIVTANILADVLVPLTPVIVHQMKKRGLLYHLRNPGCKGRGRDRRSQGSRADSGGGYPPGRMGIRNCEKKTERQIKYAAFFCRTPIRSTMTPMLSISLEQTSIILETC